MYNITQTGTSDTDIGAYASLLQAVFPNAARRLTTDYLTWQYRNNPIGPVVGFDARSNNKLAAHYVTLPVEYCVEGQKRRGLLSLNTATAPDHQGKGLFIKLAELTYERASELGYDFVVGVANQNSTHGFTKKLGFQLIAPLEARIGIGFSHYPDSEQMRNLLLYPEHSPDWLRWRLRNPSQTYHMRSGQIVTNTGIPGLVAIMSELKSSRTPEVQSPYPLARSFHPFSLWIGIEPTGDGHGLSLPIPMRFRPSPLNFIFKNLKENNFKITKAGLRFELIDFDAY